MTGCGSDWPQVGRCCWGGGGVGLSCCPQQRDLEAAQEVADRGQARSLPHFYSVDFSLSRISVKSAPSTYAQSTFTSVVVDSVLVAPRLTEVSLDLCSSGGNI